VLVAELIQQEFDVVYNRFYVGTLLKNRATPFSRGYSFQKAQVVSDHLDEARRQTWLEAVWPQLLQQAKRKKALILFVDEASFAPWGSLSYTWARRGHTPLVKTSGKRKAYKVFGAGLWCRSLVPLSISVGACSLRGLKVASMARAIKSLCGRC
jgi:hypothetical protein